MFDEFLAQGRFSAVDHMVAREIFPTGSCWLGLWVAKAFRQGNLSVSLDAISDSLASVFVDDYARPAQEHQLKEIEKSVLDELECVDANRLIITDSSVALPYAHGLEQRLKAHAERLLSAKAALDAGALSGEAVNTDQLRAVEKALEHTLCLITGGPGTGKTYTAGTWLRSVAGASYIRAALVAPTGRAVQALESSIRRFVPESVSVDAHTIHRAVLRSSILPYHVLIIDECSMIDSALLLQLFERVHEGTRVLMLGDANQLPPIEPGAPFIELLQTMPSASLNICQRTQAPTLLALADRVRSRQKIGAWLEQQMPAQDVVCYNCTGAADWERARQAVEQYVVGPWKENSSLDSLRQAIVLSPVRRGPWGSDTINASVVTGRFEPVVICKNAPHLELTNGELGLHDRACQQIHFPHAVIPSVVCPVFERAYAMSVHKSQGSEFDTVVFVLPPGSLVDWRLIYTAVTRAKKKLILIADFDHLDTMVSSV